MSGTELVIAVCYCLLSAAPFLVWPSRWNVIGHLGIWFSVIAYVIPVLVLDQLDRYPERLLTSFASILAGGTVLFLFGLALGTYRPPRWMLVTGHRASQGVAGVSGELVKRRLIIMLIIGIALTVMASLQIGALPLFADDPYSAKYFRGAYAIDSFLTSSLYRLGTACLTVLPALALALALTERKRRILWFGLSGVSGFLMLATLQRGPMAEGILIILALVLIRRGHAVASFVSLGASFVAGTLFYTILGVLGIRNFSGGAPQTTSLLEQIASTAPDVTDTMSFLNAWQLQGSELTWGRTMFGGLVPGQYPWNPAVWSLVTQNYGTQINDIRSGGLRLPLPLWGQVNFSLVGCLLISFAVGVLTAMIVRTLRRVWDEQTNDAGRVAAMVLANTALLTLASFYFLAYLEVIKAAVLLWVLWPALRGVPNQERMPEGAVAARSRQHLASQVLT